MIPNTGRPLDLSYASLRSVSPVHVEYMRNMGTAASMSISILRDGELWGLISCHHAEPRVVPFEVRAACDFLGQVLSLQARGAGSTAQDTSGRLELKSLQASLAGRDGRAGRFPRRPGERPERTAGVRRGAGGGDLSRRPLHPDRRDARRGPGPAARRLARGRGRDDVYSTDSLAEAFPEAGEYQDRASGLLAIAISKLHPSYVLWFRPEVIRTVGLGRRPAGSRPSPTRAGRLHPRKSFEMWKETVRDKSAPLAARRGRGRRRAAERDRRHRPPPGRGAGRS